MRNAIRSLERASLITQGTTLEEAHENLREAAQLVLQADRELVREETVAPDSGGGAFRQQSLGTVPTLSPLSDEQPISSLHE